MSALEIADIIGIICFALSGFLIAVHYKLDILGVFISSFLTALGGGMIRDVLADRIPYVFTTNLPVILVVATVLISLLFNLHKTDDLEGKTAFIVSDAIGLVSFSITGSSIGICPLGILYSAIVFRIRAFLDFSKIFFIILLSAAFASTRKLS